MAFVGTWLVSALATAVAVWIVPGMVPLGGIFGIVLFSLAIALVNATVRPLIQMLSLPLTIVTLGLFHFVINAAALMLASWLTLNFFDMGVYITGFGSALIGSLIISLVSAAVEAIMGVEVEPAR